MSKQNVQIAELPGNLSEKKAHALFTKENPGYEVKAARLHEDEGSKKWKAILQKKAEMEDELGDVFGDESVMEETDDVYEDEELTDSDIAAKLTDVVDMLQECIDKLNGEEETEDFEEDVMLEEEPMEPMEEAPIFSSRKKEPGLTLAKAKKEAKELVGTPGYKGLKLAKVTEKPDEFVATFVRS